MFGLNKKKPIAEHQASGDIERVYHEIRQTLRVSGVNLNFRTWAAYGDFLPLMWHAIAPNAATMAFENAADQLRVEAVQAAAQWNALNVSSGTQLGDSQTFQVRAALDLYHYINPKLLLLTSAVTLVLRGEHIGSETHSKQALERVSLGAPAKMFAMEMESDEPEDDQLKNIFRDIQETLSLRSVNSDYRTLAMWPDYLAVAWQRLKDVVQSEQYKSSTARLRQRAQTLARTLPYPVRLDRRTVRDVVSDVDEVVDVTEHFERLLPGLIINIALLELDWQSATELERSPFPAAVRREPLRGDR